MSERENEREEERGRNKVRERENIVTSAKSECESPAMARNNNLKKRRRETRVEQMENTKREDKLEGET